MKKNNSSAADFVKEAAEKHIKFSLPKDERKYPGQQCQSDSLNEKFRILHKFLVDTVIKFCVENHITIDEFRLSADMLEHSIKSGQWEACTDSGLTFEKYSDEYKKAFWEMNKEFLASKTKHELDMLEFEQEPYMFSM